VADDEQVQLNVRVRPAARQGLKALAALRGKPQGEVLEEIIERFLHEALVEAAETVRSRGRRVMP
jgi:predicted DNA-binding protein